MTGFAPTPRLLVFEAIDFAVTEARVGSPLRDQDAHLVFAPTSRFPEADVGDVDWQHR